MKKILAAALSLAMIICSLPASSIAFAADDAAIHPYENIGMTLVSNSFDNLDGENLPSSSNSSFNTSSAGEFDTTRWFVNNNMIMNQSSGSDSSSALEFIGSGGDYPGAFIDLDNQFFGSDTLGTDGYAGLTEGLVVTEFDIMANSAQHLALLGTGTTSSSSISTSTTSAYIFKEDGKLGSSSKEYAIGEWGRVKIVSNLYEKSLAYYYNGDLIHTAAINNGFGVKECGGSYGLMFQGGGSGFIDFVVDNFSITFTNVIHLGKADFNSFEMPSDYRLDGAFVPRGYVDKFDFGAATASITEGKNGGSDKALKFTPNGSGNPNYRFYYQNKSYNGATTGVFHGQFDIKLEANFRITLSNGWGLGFGDDVFSANGSVGSASYNNTDWYHVDVVSDYNSKKLTVYLEGTAVKTVSNPSAMLPTANQYFQIIVWGNAAAGSSSVLLDNISFDYYNLPEVKGAAYRTADSDGFINDDTIAANATAIRLNLTKSYTYVGSDDIDVTVGGEAVSVTAAANDDATLDITLPSEVGAEKEIVITIKKSATVGTVAPQGYDKTITLTSSDEIYTKPTEPDMPEVDETLLSLNPYKAYEKVLLFNDFDNIGDTPTAGASGTVAASETNINGDTKSYYMVNNGMTMSSAVGSDGTGKALGLSASTSSGYPGFFICMDDQFFGVNNTQSLAGGKSGNFKTEFDIKMNSNGDLSAIGTGLSSSGGIAGYSGNKRGGSLFFAEGNMVDGTTSYSNTKWHKVVIYTDYVNGKHTMTLDGKVVHQVSASQGFGNKLITVTAKDSNGAVGLMGVSNLDCYIDNLKISYIEENVMPLGELNFAGFDSVTGVSDLNNLVISKGDSVGGSNNLGMANLSTTSGPEGGSDVALKIVPTANYNGIRFYRASNEFQNTRLGTLCFSMHVKFSGDNLGLGLCNGFGDNWGTNQFTASNCADGKWHKVHYVVNFDKDILRTYIDGVLVNDSGIPYNFYKDSTNGKPYFEIQVRGYDASKPDSSVSIDNLSWKYIEGEAFGSVDTSVSDTNANAKVYSNFASTGGESYTLMIASYIGNKLDKVTLKTITPVGGSVETFTDSLTGISADATNVKAFVWTDSVVPAAIGGGTAIN